MARRLLLRPDTDRDRRTHEWAGDEPGAPRRVFPFLGISFYRINLPGEDVARGLLYLPAIESSTITGSADEQAEDRKRRLR